MSKLSCQNIPVFCFLFLLCLSHYWKALDLKCVSVSFPPNPFYSDKIVGEKWGNFGDRMEEKMGGKVEENMGGEVEDIDKLNLWQEIKVI